MTFLKRQNNSNGEETGGCRGIRLTENETLRGTFPVIEMFCILTVVVVIQIYTCVKIHRPIHKKKKKKKPNNFTVCSSKK